MICIVRFFEPPVPKEKKKRVLAAAAFPATQTHAAANTDLVCVLRIDVILYGHDAVL